MLNLGPIIKSEKSGWEGGLWPWKYGQGEGSRGTGNPGGRGGGSKTLAIRRGVWIFSGITQFKKLHLMPYFFWNSWKVKNFPVWSKISCIEMIPFSNHLE